MCRPSWAITGVLGLALILLMPQSPARSLPLLDQQENHAYVPPITPQLHGGSSQTQQWLRLRAEPGGRAVRWAYQRSHDETSLMVGSLRGLRETGAEETGIMCRRSLDCHA